MKKLEFNMNRIGHLIKNDIQKNKKSFLFMLLGSFILISLFAFMLVITGEPHFVREEMHMTFFPFILFLLGFILTSMSFRELNETGERMFYLNLPASHLEKFISKVVISFFIVPIILYCSYFFFALIFNIVLSWNTDEAIVSFSVFKSPTPYVPKPIQLLPIFLATNTVAFLGAIMFRTLEFFKTLVGLMVLYFSIFFIFSLAMFLFVPDFFNSFFMGTELKQHPSDSFWEFFNGGFKNLAFIVLFLILPLLLLVASYFKLTEKEV